MGTFLFGGGGGITNLYPGTQENCSKGYWDYNIQSDVFKDYGFDTCNRWNSPGAATVGLGYSYLVDQTSLPFSIGDEFVLSFYYYTSEDCNAYMNVRVESNGTIFDSNTPIKSYYRSDDMRSNYISSDIKGKVQWCYLKFRIAVEHGVHIMFYPELYNGGTDFSYGYQLYAGITLYKGTDIMLPQNNNINGTGIIQNTNVMPKIGEKYIIANDFIEN